MRCIALVLAFLGLVAAASPLASAKGICEPYRNTAPLPDWYREYCSNDVDASLAQLGGAFSSFADSFNLNPAAIPTSPGPFGVEYIGSYTPDASEFQVSRVRHNFALIKGYQRIGAGISTNSDDTFYSNSLVQNFQGTSYGNPLQSFVPDSIAPTLNFGTAVALVPESQRSFFSPNLGLTLRYNKYNQKFSPGAGLSLNSRNITLGASLIRESETQYSPAVTFYTATAGFRSSYFQLEYLFLKNQTDFDLVSEPIHILTASLSYRGLVGTAAVRRLVNFEATTVIQGHFAVQYQFSRYFAAGYLYNYIPGTQPLGAQIFL